MLDTDEVARRKALILDLLMERLLQKKAQCFNYGDQDKYVLCLDLIEWIEAKIQEAIR